MIQNVFSALVSEIIVGTSYEISLSGCMTFLGNNGIQFSFNSTVRTVVLDDFFGLRL